MGAPRVTKEAIKRAIEAAQESGLAIGDVIVNNIDGTIRVVTRRPESVDGSPPGGQSRAPKQWATR